MNVNKKHQFKIYRKPTQTSHTIHKTSNHPYEHKMAAYNHLINRLNKIPLTQNEYKNEYNIIVQVAIENGYSRNMIEIMNKKHRDRQRIANMTTLRNTIETDKKYIVMEYTHHNINDIKNVFKKHGYTLAFSTKNKIENKIGENKNNTITCGVYMLKCSNCPAFYIGQTGRSFEIRYREHIHEINKRDIKSHFALHLTEHQHTVDNIQNNLTIMVKMNKGKMLNRREELEIYKHKDNSYILNDKIIKNTVYEKIMELCKK